MSIRQKHEVDAHRSPSVTAVASPHAQGSQTDVARIPCHHEHLTRPERTKKPPHATGGRACDDLDEKIAEMSPVRGGTQQPACSLERVPRPLHGSASPEMMQ